MYKIYCTVTTPSIEALAKELGVSDSFANNLVSTWQSVKGMPGVEPDIDELKEFMEANKDAMRTIQLAMPVYDTMSDPNFGPGAMVNPDASIVLNMFEKGTPFSFMMDMVDSIPGLSKHKDLITDFPSFYALELYAAKIRINRGALDEPTSEKDYDYAAKLLKQAKKEFPNEFPEVRKNIPARTDNGATGSDMPSVGQTTPQGIVRSMGAEILNNPAPESRILGEDMLKPEKISKTDTYTPKYYEGTITPDKDTVFVFGSNPEGGHDAGAAKIAREQFGAEYGVGEGLTGNAYALPTKRVKNMTPIKTGQMTFSYGKGRRADIKSDTTLEAIINGERTATTRYSTDGHIDYWKDLKIGDIVAFTSSDKKTKVYVKITKPLTKLDSSINPEEWSKKEGWSVEYYNNKVKSKVEKGQAYQMEYEFVDAYGERTITPTQITENIKKLYDTARQNPDKQFKVAYRNTDTASLNGYTGLEMIEMFKDAGPIPSNIIFSKEWVDTGRFQDNNQVQKSAENQTPAYVADPNDVPKIGVEILDVDRNNPRARLVRDFTPFELSARVENIARRFTGIVDEMVDELVSEQQEMIASASGEEKAGLEARLKKIMDPVVGRRMAIQAITFNRIYERIRNEFIEYAETSEEDFDDMYGEGNGHIIKEKYQRIVDNFEALFEDACTIIEGAENLRVVLDKVDYNDGKSIEEKVDASIEKSTRDEDNEEEEFGDDEEGSRATGNEGWSFKVRFVDPYSSLSANVKRALNDIEKVRPDGEPDVDDLGNVRYISDSYAHAVLIDKLSSMIDADDFSAFDENGNLTFPALEEVAKTQPWVNQVINKLHADPDLASLFFADFRKDFIPYWKQKMDRETGQLSSMALNQPVALDSTMSNVITNYEQGTVLDEDSLYDNLGKVVAANAEKGLRIADEALASFQELEDDEDFERLGENIRKGLRMLGFNTGPSVVSSLLETEKGIVAVENVARAMGEIFEAAQSLDDNSHLINALNEPYRKIAGIVGEVNELDNIQSFREGDKTHYSYSAPNYVDTMFKLFKSDERRQGYIDSQFKAYDWFFNKRTGQWNNEWLRLLESDTDVQDKLALKELNSIDKMTKRGITPAYYTEWEPAQIKKSFILEYFSIGENKGSKKQFAWYNFPIFSDSPVVKFVKFLRYTGDFKSQLRPLLNKVVRQEIGRIDLVRKRANAGAPKIQNFDKSGGKFNFFPELNSVIIGGKSFLDTIIDMKKAKDAEGIENLINEQIDIIMDNNFNKFMNEYQTMTDNGPDMVNVLIDQGIASSPEGAMEKLEEYFWNQSFATSQIIQLTTTDLAFYKNGTDFQKRYKEVYAAGTKLNTNSKYGRKKEKTIYLADNIITSANYLDIRKNIMDAVKAGRITDMDADSILYKFRDINVADAQAYRSISSFRSVLDMMGQWTEDMEAAVERFTHGEWDMSDFNIVWQTIKPFVFTQIDKPDGIGGRMKVPHQNKNSEFLLLSTFSMIANRMSKSPKMRALNRFMEDNQIDVSQFESSVKAGGQGIIDINTSESKVKEALGNGSISVKGREYSFEANSFMDIKEHFDSLLDDGKLTQDEYNDIMSYFEPSEQEVYSMLESATKDSEGNFKEEVVHEIPYGDYVVQQPTPEHLFDVNAVFGSQFRNLIISDMPEDMEIVVNGTAIKGRDNIISLYQSLIIENLLEDYNKLSKRFNTIEDLQKAMLETIKGNPKYGRDMLDALRIVEHVVNGEKVRTFNIPLHNPSTTVKIQELVNSMFKNAITKQHIKGGNCILVSDFGFTDKLHILRNEDGSIKGAECYMPFYTKEYFQPFMKDVTDEEGNVIGQEVDIDAIRKQDPELLKIVGYRIPTEDKYSMLPLIIKGFLPQQNGSSIMLPADVTQIAGSDKLDV